MSATLSWSGPSTVKLRSTRSSGSDISSVSTPALALAASVGALDAGQAHQPGDGLAVHHLAAVADLGGEPLRAVDLAVLLPRGGDDRQPGNVALLLRAGNVAAGVSGVEREVDTSGTLPRVRTGKVVFSAAMNR
jgi:hypothetical protein